MARRLCGCVAGSPLRLAAPTPAGVPWPQLDGNRLSGALPAEYAASQVGDKHGFKAAHSWLQDALREGAAADLHQLLRSTAGVPVVGG